MQVARLYGTGVGVGVRLGCLQAAAAETVGWRETYEKDASAVLYHLQHLVAENGELEELHKKGVNLTSESGIADCERLGERAYEIRCGCFVQAQAHHVE